MSEGKDEFYRKAEASLLSSGYQYFDGDKAIHGKGPQHRSKPDYIAKKGQLIVIGEIKSPREKPTSSSWRQIQNSDGERFKSVRLRVSRRETEGKIAKEVGGHEIIICGQLPDYLEKMGKTYDLPINVDPLCKILLAYTFPASERNNVNIALRNANKIIKDVVDIGNGSTTYIYE